MFAFIRKHGKSATLHLLNAIMEGHGAYEKNAQ